MPKESSGIKFYLKNPKEKSSPIKAIFYYNYLRFTYTEPKLRVETQFWNANDQRARNTKLFPGAAMLNRSLNLIESAIIESYREFINQNNNQPSLEELSSLVKQRRGRGNKQNNKELGLFEFIEDFIEKAKCGQQINLNTGKPISKVTIRTYEQTLRVLRDFSKLKYKNLGFDDIDVPFYSQFVHFLRKEYKSEASGTSFKVNTIGKHITNIKSFLQNAVDNKLTTNLSFKSKQFRVVHETVESVYLTQEEIDALYYKDLSKTKTLERVRDLFIIGCETGLRISDLKRLTTDNIIEHDGDKYIRIEMQKTEKPVIIPISVRVKELFDKYVEQTGELFPKAVSDQKMNQYIKEIASKIELLNNTVSYSTTVNDKRVSVSKPKYDLITNHTARRSFATNAVIKGISRTMVMAITGHKTEKSFNKYIRLDEMEKAKLFKIENENSKKLRVI
ncbi:MAG: tyrosine-type recombinase/integrase [Leadbetterella sp.]|nr:tyrosine-type recombinase/integrase [Leadbetterella sp.]